MKESFIFYRSFYEAIEDLDDKKRLKMYDAITKLALKNEENEKLNGICKQLFVLIKPQITANSKRYEDGKKGGRPKKEKTSGYFEKKPNENVNVNENDNVNKNVNDLVCNLDFEKCFKIYSEKCTNLLPLNFERRNKIILEELNQFLIEIDYSFNYFISLCLTANELKIIVDKKIDFRSMVRNHIGIMNGKYEVKTSQKRGVSQEFIKDFFANKRTEEVKSG